MSLTSFIETFEVQQMFKKEFPTPKIKFVEPIRFEPQTNDYSIIGTAFDYLFRFKIEFLNPNCISRSWVAEAAYAKLQKRYSTQSESLSFLESEYTNIQDSYKKFKINGECTHELIRGTMFLAILDIYFRTGRDYIYIHKNYSRIKKDNILYGFSKEGENIHDLQNLFNGIPQDIFLTKNKIFLNPFFGEASTMIRGADADVIIEDTLIDIKVTKHLKLTRDYYSQLIGYYLLYRISGVNNNIKHEINNLGIYFARHSLLWKIPIMEIGNEQKFKKMTKWFRKLLKD